MLLQQLVNGLTLGAVLALIAAGYSLVYGVTGTIQFAFGEIFMIGAYLVAILLAALGAAGLEAGAALAAAVLGDSGAATAVAAAILGGALTAAVHTAKSGTRAALNTSPEPFSNWTASLAEDAIVPLGLWVAVAHPLLFFVLRALFLVGAALLVRLIWRGLSGLTARLR